MGDDSFRLRVVGSAYPNPDGTSRQAAIKDCWPGERVELVREPENPHDHLAVAVYSPRGVQVGYLGRDRAAWVAPKMDRGADVRAIVERVRSGGPPDAPLGMVVRLNMQGHWPEVVIG